MRIVLWVAVFASWSLTPVASAEATIKVAAVQVNVLGTQAEVLAALQPYVERAGKEAVDLLVFPEYVLGDFKIPDALTEGLCAMAKQHRLNLIAGGWQTLEDHPIANPKVPGTYANCALIINRDGLIVGMHYKNYAAIGDAPHFWPATPGELGENTMKPGDSHTVVELDFGKVGVLTCYDGYFFHSFEAPSLLGAEVLVWINGRGGAVEDYIVRAASFMACTHVVATNQDIGAGTMICAYAGQIQTIASEPGPAYLSAELDLDALRERRRNHRMFHQWRPELVAPLAEPQQPWEAYPELPFHQYPEEYPEE
jgi:predicted amidohydrolase